MAKPNSEVIENKALPQIIFDDIRMKILEGTFAPGSELRQEELAARYGTSRVPIREAMNRLEASGLAILRPRRGYAVTSLDPHEIQEIFELRAVIEEHAGSAAAGSRNEEDVVALEKILRAMEELPRKSATYFEAWATLNREFHGSLFGVARRRHVDRVASMLRDAVEPYIRLETLFAGDLTDAEAEHRRILEAFAAGDAETVGRLSRAHCESTARRLMEALPTAAG